MNSKIIKEINQKLDEIEKKENIKILLAVESGSRAWGFASPDSDYDVRFIYVRDNKDYLRINEIRDVIEWQLDDTLDINGWDIKKTLILLKKSNPTIFEWWNSPIIYRKNENFLDFSKYLESYFSSKKLLFHYLNMARGTYKENFKGSEVKLKKYFYVLRPIFAAKWIINKNSIPPIEFLKLLEEEKEIDSEIKNEIEKLLEIKLQISETGKNPRIAILDKYIEKNLEFLENEAQKIVEKRKEVLNLDKYFCKIVLGIRKC